MTTRPRFVVDKKSEYLAYIQGKSISLISLQNPSINENLGLILNTNSNYTNVALFSDPKLFCIVSNTEKILYIFNLENKSLNKLKTSKKVMDLQYVPSNQSLYIADKFGDVHTLRADQFNENDKNAFKLEAGHLGSLTQMLLTADEKYFITSDRDERIRVSHFPNIYDIWNFCLGHEQAVTSLCEVKETTDRSVLVSGALDYTLKTWDILDDENPLRNTIQLQDYPTILRSRGNAVFVAFEKANYIRVYKAQGFDLIPVEERTIQFKSEIYHFEIIEYQNSVYLIALLSQAPNFTVIRLSNDTSILNLNDYSEFIIDENTFTSLSNIAFTFNEDESTYISKLKKHVEDIKKKKVPTENE